MWIDSHTLTELSKLRADRIREFYEASQNQPDRWVSPLANTYASYYSSGDGFTTLDKHASAPLNIVDCKGCGAQVKEKECGYCGRER